MDSIDTSLNEGSEKTQSFSLGEIDATIPGIESTVNAQGEVELVMVRGPYSGERFILDVPEITIGRDPGCEVFLNDRTVSRRHAHISIQAGKILIEDLGSLNGTWIDGAIVSQAELHNGSSIQIGTFKMILNVN